MAPLTQIVLREAALRLESQSRFGTKTRRLHLDRRREENPDNEEAWDRRFAEIPFPDAEPNGAGLMPPQGATEISPRGDLPSSTARRADPKDRVPMRALCSPCGDRRSPRLSRGYRSEKWNPLSGSSRAHPLRTARCLKNRGTCPHDARHRTQEWSPLLGSIRCSPFASSASLRKTGSTCPHDALPVENPSPHFC